MTTLSFEQLYTKTLSENHWQRDPAQLEAVAALSRFSAEFTEAQRKTPKLLARLLKRSDIEPVTGVYLYGGVGRGKTFLMDLLVDYLADYNPVRLHFHRFMIEVHESLNDLREQSDPLALIAKDWATRSKLLCFDEFYVSDIADAMILGRFVTKLFNEGVSLVTTSNIAPDNLYKDGLSRELFMPAIAAIKAHCEVVELKGAQDYRMLEREGLRSWFGTTPQELAEFAELFSKLAGKVDTSFETVINRRAISVVRKGASAVWFRFDVLCAGFRSAADYVELTKRFQWMFIEGFTHLGVDDEDAARRFIALVDEAYDRRVKLVVSANCSIEDWYRGRKLEFVSERTISRLQEMQSYDYWHMPHLG